MFFFFFDINSVAADEAWTPVQRLLAASRAHYPQLSVGALETFIHVARNQQPLAEGKLNLPQIARDLMVPYSTLARHTDVLAHGVSGRAGLKLITKQGGRGRVRNIEITPAGMAFLAYLHKSLRLEAHEAALIPADGDPLQDTPELPGRRRT